ncbi:hypothetical protein TTHERM_00825670 (macronuclear) [Tetrahymena thermophila SB210]|uniref:Uncharacterized protein n=1 Tax=Tetrahymena thermophila (strain SB210) TaxID=312017 RepID=I7LZF2_TETTS|nr:hypothetical protein TTHERM_00825670 [Tetrahymena thermophila SB210]EAR83772.2 hypothetical protein TTHERM_00825670 [Tetrahymena thermophila SB210]|eukprot:XP_001031435.2 hypothetical protein TTHERM_00825670 [Tetrahymena thermophila SB210]
MKKSLSKQQLKADTPQSKNPLMTTSNYSSQQKQLLTDSSLVQIGSDFCSNYKNYQNSGNSNSGYKQKQNQLQMQNVQANEENWIHKQKQLNQIIKQICDPSQNINEINNEHLQNLNIPPLTYVSASKAYISQKKKSTNQEQPQNKEQLKINRAGSLEYKNYQNKPSSQGQQQTLISNFQEISKKNSYNRLDLPQTQNQKNKSKANTPSQSKNSNLNNSSLNTTQQRRLSVYDLNIVKSKQNQTNNDQQQTQYFSVNNNHLNCILPQRTDSKGNTYSQIPNFERGESSSSAKKSSKKNTDNHNSASSQSPSQSKQPQADNQQSNNQLASQNIDRKLQNVGSSSTNYSLNSNGAVAQNNFYSQGNQNSIMSSQNNSSNNQNSQANSQQNPPYISQTTSYYSTQNNNNREIQSFIMNEKMVNNEYKQKLNQEEEMNSLKQKIGNLEKQNDDLRDNCQSLEKENQQLRRILSEQEQVMSKMKNLYSSLGNDDSNYKSNHPNDQDYNSNQITQQNDNLHTKENYAKYEFENNQLRLKNQEFSIRIKVLQENIRELEYKSKDYQSDIGNLIEVKKQLELDLLQAKNDAEQKQQIINSIMKQRGQEEILNQQNDQTEENVKRTKLQLNTSPDNFIIQSTQKNNSIENYQLIKSIPAESAVTVTPLVNEFDTKKMDQENQSLLYKIEDLECQLHQVYKSLNSSPSKSMQNLDLYPDNRLLFLGASSEQLILGNTESQLNGQLYTFEQVKQLILQVENLKNTLKDQQNQLVLWQERYNNLEIVHQSLLSEKASNYLEHIQINPDQSSKEQLKEQVQSLLRQIDDMNLITKNQENEITFLKMTVQQKNIEIQDQQIKLESKEATYQMIKKRMQDLEEQNIQAYSQKGQLKVQVKQLQELFDNQKTELNNVYQLLKTRSLDLESCQKQIDEQQNQNRKQQISLQIYQKEMDDLVTKNNKLQNQIYELINQNAQNNTQNFLLNQQKELSQNLLQKLNSQLKTSNNESNLNSNVQQNNYMSNTGYQFNFPVVNSYEYPIQQNQNSYQPIQVRNSFENPTFGNLNSLNTAKNLTSENQLSRETSIPQNQLSSQNQNVCNQQQECSQIPPIQFSSQITNNQNNRISNFSDFELTKSKIDENFNTQVSNTIEKSVYISQ